MTVFDEVVNAFFAAWVARYATGLAQVGETTAPTRDNFVHVRLMARVPQNRIAWRLENSMKCKRQFDRTKV